MSWINSSPHTETLQGDWVEKNFGTRNVRVWVFVKADWFRAAVSDAAGPWRVRFSTEKYTADGWPGWLAFEVAQEFGTLEEAKAYAEVVHKVTA